MSPTQKNVRLMLNESNKIEQIYDKRSLSDAAKAWKFINMFDSLNKQIILETHKILMKNQDIDYKYKGEWRDIPVWIGGKHKSQPRIVIDAEMTKWIRIVNTLMEDPIQLHIDFEFIHPFIDGNGRMGRILMNWQAVRQLNHLIVFYDQTKQDYYRLFR